MPTPPKSTTGKKKPTRIGNPPKPQAVLQPKMHGLRSLAPLGSHKTTQHSHLHTTRVKKSQQIYSPRRQGTARPPARCTSTHHKLAAHASPIARRHPGPGANLMMTNAPKRVHADTGARRGMEGRGGGTVGVVSRSSAELRSLTAERASLPPLRRDTSGCLYHSTCGALLPCSQDIE